jgi:type IV pilus assembly protein PilC
VALRKQEQLYFVERMLVLLDAGLPLLDSLALMQQSASPAWQKIMAFIAHHLQQGERFSQCLSMQHAVFDPAFIGLIRVSEESGEITLPCAPSNSNCTPKLNCIARYNRLWPIP